MRFEQIMLCIVTIIAVGFILLFIMALMRMATWADENMRVHFGDPPDQEQEQKNGDDNN